MRLSALCLTVFAVPAIAEEPLQLAFPLDCKIGTSCYVEDYVDLDTTRGKQADFACGINTRDGHKGTDIALLSFDAIATGVTVSAAAPGQVTRIRDGMADDRLMRGVTAQNACGNAILVDHHDGWQTLYCHLRKGSITVSEGDLVQSGDPMAKVGLSGMTNHPHLHLQVMKNGQVVDPFHPEANGQCGTPGRDLWQDAPPYTETGLITAGFADHMPTLATVRDGSARAQAGAPELPLVVYAYIGHAKDGDLLTLSADGPGGEVFRRDILLKSPQKALFQGFGRKAPDQGWPTGDYLGEALLTRNGEVIAHRFAHVSVLPR